MNLSATFVLLLAAISKMVLISQGRNVKRFNQRMIDQYSCLDGRVDKDLCMKIMKQPILRRSLQYLLKESDQELLTPRRKRSATPTCPQMTDEYLRTHTEEGERSLSPYRFVKEKNSNRFPEIIYQAQCLCHGCIDPNNHSRQTHEIRSIQVTQGVNVLMDNNGDGFYDQVTTEEVAAGCTCAFPVTNPVSSR